MKRTIQYLENQFIENAHAIRVINSRELLIAFYEEELKSLASKQEILEINQEQNIQTLKQLLFMLALRIRDFQQRTQLLSFLNTEIIKADQALYEYRSDASSFTNTKYEKNRMQHYKNTYHHVNRIKREKREMDKKTLRYDNELTNQEIQNRINEIMNLVKTLN